jgi:transposase InsO family protein
VTALLRDAGWTVNRKRVERIWRKEGLKVPQRQPNTALCKNWDCLEQAELTGSELTTGLRATFSATAASLTDCGAGATPQPAAAWR